MNVIPFATSWSKPSLLALGAVLLATPTTHAQTTHTNARPVAAPQPARGTDGVLSLEFRIVRRTDRDRVLLGGRTALENGRHIAFSSNPGGSAESVEFVASARAIDPEQFVTEVRWTERTPTGGRVEWSPTLVVGRGHESVAEIDWGPGDSRVLQLSLR